MIKRYTNDLHAAISATAVTVTDIGLVEDGPDRLVSLFSAPRERHAIIVGNGGSQAIASHVAIDLCKAAGVPALSLNDPAALTCLANDYGYADVYAKQIEWHGRSNDVLVVISASGQSENILRAAWTGVAIGMNVVTFTGFEPTNPLRSMGHMNFYTPSFQYGFVELAHQVILHAVTDALMSGQIPRTYPPLRAVQARMR